MQDKDDPRGEVKPGEFKVIPWLDNLDLLFADRIAIHFVIPAIANPIQHLKKLNVRNGKPIHHPYPVNDAREVVRQMENELSRLKATLEVENESKFLIDRQELSILERQVKEAASEMDDIVDAWINSQAKWSSRYFVRKQLTNRSLTIESEVKSITEQKLKPIIDQVQRELVDTSGSSWNHKLAPTRDSVVGLEDQLSMIINDINERSDTLKVISITGMRGMGKTTMALRIFHDPSIMSEFPIRIWVYISEDSNIRDVLLTILTKFTGEDMSITSTDHDLLKTVREHLRLRKFLIVMDGVPTQDAWNVIVGIFRDGSREGRVLLTTHDENVASSGTQSHPFRSLNLKESLELLQLKIFGRNNDYPPEFEKVGNSLAATCHGHPLAILVIGGILFDKSPSKPEIATLEEKWKKMILYTDPQIDEKSMEHIISLSYDALPLDLRDCFLYLGMFPDHTEIPVRRLIQLWIGEGFIRQKLGKSLEETARSNVEELIRRNLLMVDKTNILNEVNTCRVHDIVRQFCKREGIEKQNLFAEIRMSNEGSLDKKTSPPGDEHHYHRVCVHSYDKILPWRKSMFAMSRSFLYFSKRPVKLEDKDVSRFTGAFSMVRVMDASPIVLPRFPEKLTEQFHLRCLTLSVDELKVLPRCISELWNLQTLVVNTSSHTLECETNIWKMLNLRHFMTKASVILKNQESGERGSENLQTVTKLSPQSLTDDVIKKVKTVKKLGVRGVLSGLMCFEIFHALEKLTLQHDVYLSNDSKTQIMSATLPMPQKFPPKLRYLVLSGTRLDWKDMCVLEKIANLQVLKLKNNAFCGDSWAVSRETFIHLEALSIDEADLMFWTVPSDSFGKLATLELRNCPVLEEIPMELATSMEKLSIFGSVGKYAVGCAKEIELKKTVSPKGKEIEENVGYFKLRIYPGDT